MGDGSKEATGAFGGTLYNGPLPRHLFRYRSATTPYFTEEMTALRRQEIFVPPSSSVNDPYDCQPAVALGSTDEIFQFMREYNNSDFWQWRLRSGFALERLKMPNLSWRLYKRAFKKKVPNFVSLVRHDQLGLDAFVDHRGLLDWRIASFSAREFHPLMWAYYADNYCGICVRYRTEPANYAFDARAPLPVVYQSLRPNISRLKIWNMANYEYFNNKTVVAQIMKDMFLTKSEDWQHEQEWRIVMTAGSEIGYHRFSMLIPDQIVIGNRAEPGLIDRVRSLTNIPILRLTQSITSYDLIAVN